MIVEIHYFDWKVRREREREREREKEKQKNLILRVIKSNENISFRKLIVKFELLNA